MFPLYLGTFSPDENIHGRTRGFMSPNYSETWIRTNRPSFVLPWVNWISRTSDNGLSRFGSAGASDSPEHPADKTSNSDNIISNNFFINHPPPTVK